MTKYALYLAGGGARGAYQAGVLKAIGELLKSKSLPFNMVSGVSVGSINAAVLAEYADDFPSALLKLETFWKEIHYSQVYNIKINKILSEFGLLNTEPFCALIQNNLDFNKITKNIKQGYLECLEIISYCYSMQRTVSFYVHSDPDFNDWSYSRHRSQRVDLQAEHILASSSLPLFFPPVLIDELHYGDGGVCLDSPLRGSVHLKADKILIISTQPVSTSYKISKGITFSSILNSMLSTFYVDTIERDIDLINRSPWHPIQALHLKPYHGLSGVIGYFFRFLFFNQQFTKDLFDAGYKDGLNNSDNILAFFRD